MNNGIQADALVREMPQDELARAFVRHTLATVERALSEPDVAHPSAMGFGMVLNARGNVYGDVRRVDPATVARRRARNKAARKARRIGRNR